MTGTSFSGLPAAELLSEDDLIALSQPQAGGGYISRKATLSQLAEHMPPGESVGMLLINPVDEQTTEPESQYNGTILLGYGATHQGAAIGDESTDNRSGSIAIGMGAAADVVATVVGRNARGTGNHGVALGTEADAQLGRSIAIGYRSQGKGEKCVAIGEKSRVTQDNSVALGDGAYAAYRYSVALGAGSRAMSGNEVSIGYQQTGSSYPATRRLAGVSEGTKDTDAVNVKQLKAALEQVTGGIQVAIESSSFDSSYGPSLSQDKAHGHMGGCEYWKTTVPLRKTTSLDYVPIHCTLQGVPCGAGGEMLPYSLHAKFRTSTGVLQVTVMLMVFGEATQSLNPETGEYTPLGESEGGAISNLRYSLTYWYSQQTQQAIQAEEV
ncbi:hypothetical protein ACTWOG_000980 [Serratia marcescens]